MEFRHMPELFFYATLIMLMIFNQILIFFSLLTIACSLVALVFFILFLVSLRDKNNKRRLLFGLLALGFFLLPWVLGFLARNLNT